MVPLRFLQCWNGYDRGQEVSFPHPGLAEDLIRMRVAEEIRPAAPTGPEPPSPPAPSAGPTRPGKAKR